MTNGSELAQQQTAIGRICSFFSVQKLAPLTPCAQNEPVRVWRWFINEMESAVKRRHCHHRSFFCREAQSERTSLRTLVGQPDCLANTMTTKVARWPPHKRVDKRVAECKDASRQIRSSRNKAKDLSRTPRLNFLHTADPFKGLSN